MLAAVALSDSEDTIPSEALAGLLGTYPLIWSTFVILISAGAVASESGVVADSILSKSVTRYDYIFAKLGGRLLTVLGVYLAVALPTAYLIGRSEASDITGAGAAWGLLLTGMILVLITSVSVALSTLFNRTMVALVVAWILWYAVGGIFGVLEIAHLSPLLVVDSLPLILQDNYDTGDQWRTLGLFGAAALAVITFAAAYFARKDL